MKVKLCIMGIMLFSGFLYADSIYLTDDTVCKGKVIRIMGESIEYDSEGDEVFRVIPKNKVTKIVYNDGTISIFKHDTVALKDGTILKGAVIRAEKEGYQFYRDDLKQSVFLKRGIVRAIRLSNEQVITTADDVSDDTFEDTEPVKRIPGFHSSIIGIRVIGGMALFRSTGELADKENRLSSDYESKIIERHRHPNEAHLGYDNSDTFYDIAVELDIMAPAIELDQVGRFSLTGIKFGLKGRYGYHVVEFWAEEEEIYSASWTDGYGAVVMDYTYYAIGPSFNLIFSPRSNLTNLIINGYCLYGHINRSTFEAGGAIRAAGIYLDPNEYRVSFSGYFIKTGLGPQFTLNKYAPVYCGINLTHTYTRIKTDRPILVYDSARTVYHLHEWGIELALGVHF